MNGDEWGLYEVIPAENAEHCRRVVEGYREHHKYARDRLLTAANLATDAVVRTLEKEDGRLGLRVLKELGCAETGSTQPVDPEELESIKDMEPEKRDLVREDADNGIAWMRATLSHCLNLERCIRIGANVIEGVLAGELRERDYPTGRSNPAVPRSAPNAFTNGMPLLFPHLAGGPGDEPPIWQDYDIRNPAVPPSDAAGTCVQVAGTDRPGHFGFLKKGALRCEMVRARPAKKLTASLMGCHAENAARTLDMLATLPP